MSTNSLLATEAECAEGRTAPRVSLQDLENNIAAKYDFSPGRMLAGQKTDVPIHDSLNLLSICLLVTHNGFVLVGKSAPASAANFDAELGRKLAYEDAVRQLWPLMGYELRERLNNTPATPQNSASTAE